MSSRQSLEGGSERPGESTHVRTVDVESAAPSWRRTDSNGARISSEPRGAASLNAVPRGLSSLVTRVWLICSDQALVPRRRGATVPRPRLSDRLSRGIDARLTLVSAPAGFGKTTLLAVWLASAPRPEGLTAWLSLDQSDNDPTTFWTYVIAACRRSRRPWAPVPEPHRGGPDLSRTRARRVPQRARRPSQRPGARA